MDPTLAPSPMYAHLCLLRDVTCSERRESLCRISMSCLNFILHFLCQKYHLYFALCTLFSTVNNNIKRILKSKMAYTFARIRIAVHVWDPAISIQNIFYSYMKMQVRLVQVRLGQCSWGPAISSYIQNPAILN